MNAAALLFTEDIYKARERPLIVLPQPWKEVSREERQQLEKLLQFYGHTVPGVRLVSAAEPVDLVALCVWQPSCIILFGAAATAAIPAGEVHELTGCGVVRAPHLRELRTLPPEEKKNLMASLQKVLTAKV